MCGRPIVLSGALIALAVATSAAEAGERFALLVGVGDYESPKIEALRAPSNDVSIMARLLRQLDVAPSHVTMLATGHNADIDPTAPSGLPTRAAILDALDDLANRTKPGDQVLIYVSSHGTQQPDQLPGDPNHDEVDGLDEVILPYDAKDWDPRDGSVENGILDETLGAHVDNLRATGAAVWLVVDTCHSGTALRDGGVRPGIEYKDVDPATLGVPTTTGPVASALAAPMTPTLDFDRSHLGNLVVFYAVAPEQRAPAWTWPREDGTITPFEVSLLTFAIEEALASGKVKSYRELAQRIQGTYVRVNEIVTPHFEGEFNRPLMGDGLVTPRQWDAVLTPTGLGLLAGELDFVGPDALVRVTNARFPEQPGLFRVTDVTQTTASLEPAGTFDMAPFEDEYGQFRVELVRTGRGLAVSLSVPDLDPLAPLTSIAREAAETVAAEDGTAVSITNVGTVADIVLRAGADRLWLAMGGVDPNLFAVGERGQPPYLECTEVNQDCVTRATDALRVLVRARRVTRVLDQMANASLDDRMTVETFVRSANVPDGQTTCAALEPPSGLNDVYMPLSPDPGSPGGLIVGQCDQLWLRVTYSGSDSLSITPLYLSLDGSLQVMHCGARRDEDYRIISRESRQFCATIRTTSKTGRSYPVGIEHVLLLAFEEPASAPPRIYRWLATPEQAVDVLRSGNDDPLVEALAEAIDPPGVRGFAATSTQVGTVVRIPLDLRIR